MVSITNADLEIYVTENSVTTVIWKDNARVLAFGDVVRITDRDGIRYEFLYTDVIAPTSPAWSSADELADEINTYLITIPGGGGGGIDLETNGIPNGDQTKLNLVEGTNVTITDDGLGNVTIDAAGGGGGITELTGDVTAGPGSGSVAATLASNLKTGSFGVTADGVGGVVQVGNVGYVVMTYAGTIAQWYLTADVSGTVSFDITKSTSLPPVIPTASIISSGIYPTLTSQQIATGSTLTGWTTTFSAGDIFGFIIRSSPAPVTIKNVTLSLRVTKS